MRRGWVSWRNFHKGGSRAWTGSKVGAGHTPRAGLVFPPAPPAGATCSHFTAGPSCLKAPGHPHLAEECGYRSCSFPSRKLSHKCHWLRPCRVLHWASTRPLKPAGSLPKYGCQWANGHIIHLQSAGFVTKTQCFLSQVPPA